MTASLLRRSRAAVLAVTVAVTAGLALSGSADARPAQGSDASRTSAAVAAAARTDRLVFSDDFNGGSLNTGKWGVYNGGSRRASNTFVGNGVLTLRNQLNGTWTAAGLSSARALKQTYGRYVVRARFDRGYGIRAVALLWPAGGGWPPEINFLEINANDPARTQNNLTNHFTEGGHHQMSHASYACDCTRWHNFEVIWEPGRITYLMDGRITSTMTRGVSSQPMWLGLQTQVGGISASPNSSTPHVVDFEVDWVRAYDYS